MLQFKTHRPVTRLRPAVAESRGSSLSPLATRSFNGSRLQALHNRQNSSDDTRDLSALSVENRHSIPDTTANFSKSNIQHPTSKIPNLLPLCRVWKIASPVLRLGKCVGLFAVMLWAVASFVDVAHAQNTANTWTGSATGALATTPGNWSLGSVPTVANDAIFSSAVGTGFRTLTSGSLTVGSFNVTANSNTYSIRTTTTTATNSTITLGGAGNLGNNISGTSSDLLYAASGSTFNIVGPTSGSGGTGVLNLVLGQSGTFNIAGTSTISAAISGANFGFTKTGAGSLTLSGTNTYTGATTINAGTLSIATVSNGGTAGTLGNSTNAAGNFVLGGGVLEFTGINASTDRNFTLTNGTISTISVTTSTETLTLSGSAAAGNGSFTKAGAGTLTLTGASSHSGNTTVSAGTLALGNVNALQNSTLNTGSSGSQVVTLTVAGTNTYNLGGLAGADALDIAGNSLSVGSNNADSTFSGNLTGTGNLTKQGSGALILSGTNTYSGKTAINGGTISINADSRLGAAPGSVVADQLSLNGGTLAITTGFTMNTNRGITLGAGGGTINVATSETLAYGGVIAGSGNALAKTGAGTLSLSGINTYTGTTTISAGTLRLNGTASTNTIAGDILVNGGALNYQTANNEQIADTANLGVSSGVVDFVTRSESLNSLNVSGGAVNISSGTLTLGSNASFTGGTITISGTAGRISVTGSTTFGNGTIDYSHASNNNTRALVLGGNVNVNVSTTANLTNSSGGTARLDLNDASRTFTVGDNANMNIGWVVTSNNTGSGALVKAGNGTLTFSNTNTYTGGTTVNAGTLALGHATNTLADSAAVTVSGGILNLGSNNDTVGAVTITSGTIAGSGTLTGSAYALQGGTVNANLGTGTMTASIGTTTLNGAAASTSVNINSGALALGSAGSLASTATISVASGANFDLSGKSSGYSLGNGSTLNGLGTVNTASGQSLSIGAGAVIAPGTASTSGTLTVGGLTFASGGIYAFTMGNATGTAGTNWDLLSVTNNFDIAATPASPFTITIGGNSGPPTGFSNNGSYSWDILSLGSGSITGFSADKFTLTNNLAGITGAFSLTSTGAALTLNYVAGAPAVVWSSSSGSAWLTASNWTGSTVPSATDIAQFGANPTSTTTGVGINFSQSTNNGSGNQIVGAIELTSARSGNLTIGNSATSTAGTLTLNGVETAGVSNVVLKNSGAGNLTIQNTQGGGGNTLAVALANTENVIVINGSGGITINSTISGSGKNLTLQGTGTGSLTLAGSNTYTGTTTVNSGTLRMGANDVFDGSSSISIAGGTLQTVAFNDTVNAFTITSGTLAGTGTLTASTYALRGGTVNANLGEGTITVSSGTTTLTGTAAATTININSGNLTLGAANRLADTAAVTVNASLNLGGFNETIGALSGNSSGRVALGSGTLTTNSSSDTTFSGVVSGTGGLTKSGSGNLTLNGSNIYTGTTTINSGTLQANAANALGNSTVINVNGGSFLVGASDSVNDAAAINLNGGTLALGSGIGEVVGALTLSANSTLDMNSAGNAWITFASLTSVLDNSHRLEVWNYTPGSDHIYFLDSTNLANSLNYISFYSGAGTGTFYNALNTSSFSAPEVYPTIVPEPGAYFTAAILLLGIGIYFIRLRERFGLIPDLPQGTAANLLPPQTRG